MYSHLNIYIVAYETSFFTKVIKTLQKQSSKRIEMIELTFNSLFKTSNMGIPNPLQLSTSYHLPKNYYINSIVIQSLFFLVFGLSFALSIYRVLKKIKDNSFQDAKDTKGVKAKYIDRKGKNKQANKQQQKNQEYLFDEDDDERVSEKEQQNKEKAQQQKQKQSFDNYHDQYETKFISIDRKILHFHCLLISFIVSNNSLKTDLTSPLLLIMTVASFLLINIAKKFRKKKMLRNFYIWFAVLGFFPILFHSSIINF